MRAPGRKLKIHEFVVDGMAIPVEIRITDENKFYAEVDGDKIESQTFADLAKVVQPRLEALHKLVYDPVIDVEYEDPNEERHTYYGSRASYQREKVALAFQGGWVSRAPISTVEDKQRYYRWIKANVDETTFELGPLDRGRQSYAERMYERDVKTLLPFTPDRWRRLMAISAALAEAKAKLAYVLADTTAALLDAVPATGGPALLSAMPKPKQNTKKEKRS